jgi:hypothetical protein
MVFAVQDAAIGFKLASLKLAAEPATALGDSPRHLKALRSVIPLELYDAPVATTKMESRKTFGRTMDHDHVNAIPIPY